MQVKKKLLDLHTRRPLTQKSRSSFLTCIPDGH